MDKITRLAPDPRLTTGQRYDIPFVGKDGRRTNPGKEARHALSVLPDRPAPINTTKAHDYLDIEENNDRLTTLEGGE